MRIRLRRDDGSFFESEDMPEEEARALATRYFQAINLDQGPGPTIILRGTGDTHGLPAAWLRGAIVSVSTE
jgi:hypothetical protein